MTSYISIYGDIVKKNNGRVLNKSGKCGIISMGHATGIDSENYCEFIIDWLKMGNKEQLDFGVKREKLQELCDILGFTIKVHSANYLNNGLVRIWKNTQMELEPRNTHKSYEIHILWFGNHFEYVDWNKINNYPSYNETVYNLVNEQNTPSNEIMAQYNIVYSQII